MVMLNYSLEDMNQVIGKKLKLEDYEKLSFKFGLDLESNGDMLNFELSSDRVDIVSKYSLAEIFAAQLKLKIKKFPKIDSEKLGVIVKNTNRKFVNALHVKLESNVGQNFDELLAIQERLDKNIGRNRKKSSIGFFDYSKISFPITYEEKAKDEINFIPLGYSSKMSYDKIITEVKQGMEYNQLVNGNPIVWSDNNGEIVAFPPIINAEKYSITPETKELFVDITGIDRETVNAVTKILIYNLQFIGKVSLISVDYKSKDIDTHFSMDVHSFYINENSISSILGIKLGLEKIKGALIPMDYNVEKKGEDLIVSPPFYRQDVMHQVDVVDDVMRSIGLDEINPVYPYTYTDGYFLPNHYAIQSIKEILVGFGFQEVDINVLTNEKYQFLYTGIKAEDYVSLLQLKSGDVTMASKNIFPELLRLISSNLHKKFPQNVFSVSNVIEKGKSDVAFNNRMKLSVVACEKEANVTQVLSVLKKVLKDVFRIESISTDYINPGYSNSFINGRAYDIYSNGKLIGIAGELHPKVLNAFGIELPVALLEMYIDGS